MLDPKRVPRHRLRRSAAPLLAALLVVAACGSSDDADPIAEAATAVPTEPSQPSEQPDPAEEPAVSAPTATEAVPTTAPVPTPTATESEPAPSTESAAPPSPTATPLPPRDQPCTLEASAPGPTGEADLAVEVIADGLEVPWGLAVLPDGDLLVTERPGRVRLIDDGVLVAEPVLEPGVEVPPPLFGIDRLGPEGGLLGVVLHPDFAANRQFYLFYNLVNDEGEFAGRIERYVLDADGRGASIDRIILDDLPAGVHHQGGRMHIGPDRMLYVGVGAFDPDEAQDPDTLAGKLLRIDLDGGIPPDNPDPTSEIFVSGIRNTQGFDWIDDDHLVVVDHGPSGLELDMPELRGFDEVNVVRAGDNLGWPRVWGCDELDGLVAPVLSWNDSVPPTGGHLYRGDAIPAWTGSFLFTTVGGSFGQHLHRIVLADDDPYEVVGHEVHLFRQYGRLRTVVPAPDGGIYVMTSNCDNRGECPPQGDVILHVTAAGAGVGE